MGRMADAALSQSRSETSSLPMHLADLGSDNFEQELTLSLVGSEKEALEKSNLRSIGLPKAATASARIAGRRSPNRGWRLFPTRPFACSVRQSKNSNGMT